MTTTSWSRSQWSMVVKTNYERKVIWNAARAGRGRSSVPAPWRMFIFCKFMFHKQWILWFYALRGSSVWLVLPFFASRLHNLFALNTFATIAKCDMIPNDVNVTRGNVNFAFFIIWRIYDEARASALSLARWIYTFVTIALEFLVCAIAEKAPLELPQS